MVNAPSNSYNWAGIGLKPKKADGTFDHNVPVQPKYMIKYSKHDSKVEIDDSEDSANIGGSTTTIGYDRESVTSSPSYTTKILFGEGVEHDIYCALGSKDNVGVKDVEATSKYTSARTNSKVTGDESSGYKDAENNKVDKDGYFLDDSGNKTTKQVTESVIRQYYIFAPTAENRENLPLSTETKGFNFWTTESSTNAKDVLYPKILDNLIVDTCTFDLKAGRDINIEMEYKGDAPIYNVARDVTKTFKKKASKVTQNNIKIYYGAPDTLIYNPYALEKESGKSIDEIMEEANLISTSCVNELKIKIDNNLDDSDCFNYEMGVNTYDVGNFEAEVSGTFEVNRKLAREEAEWITGSKEGYYASTESYIRQILVCIEGIPILDSQGNKVYVDDKLLDYKLFMSFPKLNISDWKPSEDGDDTATIEFTGKTILSIEDTAGNETSAPCIFSCYSTPDVISYSEPYTLTKLDGSDLNRDKAETNYKEPSVYGLTYNNG